MKEWIFTNKEQLQELREQVLEGTQESIDTLITQKQGVELIRSIKFKKDGYDPLFQQSTNFIEQVNQTFTYLVSLSAVELLMDKHQEHQFRANFGTKSGYDIESIDKSIICECFAATKPKSNNKLESDVRRLVSNTTAMYRYVIYYTEEAQEKHVSNLREKYRGVTIIPLKWI